MPDLNKLKQFVFEQDNTHCFIERERILRKLEQEYKDYNGEDKYPIVLKKLLENVSTPLYDEDYFPGRVVEGPLDEDMEWKSRFLGCLGHMSFDYERILSLGLKGILGEIQNSANRKGDEKSLCFAKNAEIIVFAVKDYCTRYAQKAKEKGFDQMEKALLTVPFEPAYDFYSALCSIWIIHLIASCYVGDRDYAFGRFDKYMYPYYKKALDDGCSREQLTELLSGFFMKTNEICGRTAHDYMLKPIPSNSSNQYVMIGGESVNEFSYVVLDAAVKNNMAQPEITVLLNTDEDKSFITSVFDAMSVLTDKMNIYNYNQTVNALIDKGIPEKVAKNHTYSACCTIDLDYHTYRREHFTPTLDIFLDTLNSRGFNSVDEILTCFKQNIYKDVSEYAKNEQMPSSDERARKFFVFDSLFLTDSALECRYPCDGESKYNVLNVFLPGIATIGDSLMVIDEYVFKSKKYTYSEFMDIVNNNYENHEQLRCEILSLTRFGNDTDADLYAKRAGDAMIDGVNKVELKSNFYALASFYSLERDTSHSPNVGATPDGRKSGEPFSENQSPSYGADKSGITALLSSVAKLPFARTFAGGLNISFSQNIKGEILKALVMTYFEKGGLHVGITVADEKALRDAMAHPENYPALTVRLYGFSDYFVSLSPVQQMAIINRTKYN